MFCKTNLCSLIFNQHSSFALCWSQQWQYTEIIICSISLCHNWKILLTIILFFRPNEFRVVRLKIQFHFGLKSLFHSGFFPRGALSNWDGVEKEFIVLRVPARISVSRSFGLPARRRGVEEKLRNTWLMELSIIKISFQQINKEKLSFYLTSRYVFRVKNCSG